MKDDKDKLNMHIMMPKRVALKCLETIDRADFIICMEPWHRISPHIIILCQN
jgi:hypothetical protein